MADTNNPTNKNTAPILQSKQRKFSAEELKNPMASSVPKMEYRDIVRLSTYLQSDPSIFDSPQEQATCNIWQGYLKKKSAQLSVNNKKYPISRLLYHNFVAHLSDNQQVSYICNNKGKCATISHLKAEKRKSTLPAAKPPEKRSRQNRKTKSSGQSDSSQIKITKKKIVIDFD